MSNACIYKKLLFARPRELEESTLSSPRIIDNNEYYNMYMANIKYNNKHPSNGHLSTQLIVSSFDKFQVMLHLHPFDILTLSKPRLQHDKHLLKYVQITGYNLVILNISNNKVTIVIIKKRRKIESWIQMNTKYVIV